MEESKKEEFKNIEVRETENGYIVNVYVTKRGAAMSTRRIFVFDCKETMQLKKFISEQLGI